MRNTITLVRCLVSLLMVALFVPQRVQAQNAEKKEEVLSVPELLALQPKWPNYAAIKLPITIEGRLGSRSKTQFRMRQCDIRFLSEPGKELLPIPDGTENVLLHGFLEKNGSRYNFIVRKWEPQPADLAAFRTRRLNLQRKSAEPWYEAARWARDRAAFYQDDDLQKEAQETAKSAVLMEHLRVAVGDGAAVLTLAAKAKEWKLADRFTLELLHDAHRRFWFAHRHRGEPTATELNAGLTRNLTGAMTPLKSYPAELAAHYAKDPIATYRDAKDEIRPVLHRVFAITVLQQQIEAASEPDGANGFAIAASLEKQLPELPARAEFFRKRELTYRITHIATADRAAAVALANLLKERKQPARAEEVLQTWLNAKAPALRKEGATGLIHLSDETMRLLDDRNTAISLLKEADKLSPNSEAVTTRMKKFGFRKHREHWLTTEEFAKLPVDPAVQKVRSGEITIGMSPEEVRRSVAGTPTSILRTATHRSVSEVWVFVQPDRSRLVVHFQRKRGEHHSQSRVANSLRLSN